MVKIIFPLCGAAGNSGFGRCGECYLQHLPSIHHRLGDRDKTWEILGNIEEKGKDGLCVLTNFTLSNHKHKLLIQYNFQGLGSVI